MDEELHKKTEYGTIKRSEFRFLSENSHACTVQSNGPYFDAVVFVGPQDRVSYHDAGM